MRRAGIDGEEAWPDLAQLGLAASQALNSQLAVRAGTAARAPLRPPVS